MNHPLILMKTTVQISQVLLGGLNFFCSKLLEENGQQTAGSIRERYHSYYQTVLSSQFSEASHSINVVQYASPLLTIDLSSAVSVPLQHNLL